jgi:hypothetical protein
VAVDRRGGVLASTNPRGGPQAWKRVQAVHGSLTSISCPSNKLCVATETNRDVIVSTNPAGGVAAWQRRTADPIKEALASLSYIADVSCPSAQLCVGAGFDVTDINAFVTTAPTSTHAWTTKNIDSLPHESGLSVRVSCGSPKLCVAIETSSTGFDNLAVSTQPAKHWSLGGFPGSSSYTHVPTAVGCTGTSLCAIVDNAGNVIVGT